MPRNGSGVYSLPVSYEATTGQTAAASQHNDPLEDIRDDLNAARPVVAGGTGGTSARAAVENLGLNKASIYATYGGTADAITLTTGRSLTSLATGMEFRFRATSANTGTTTVNVDGIGNTALRNADTSVLEAGAVSTDVDTVIRYDGTRFILVRSFANVQPTITRLTSGSSATHTLRKDTRRYRIRMCGGGGGGGGADSDTDSSDIGHGAGGGAGGYAEFEIDVAALGNGNFTYTIGSGGAGGSAASGSAGGDTSYNDGTNTVTSSGGSGGGAVVDNTGVSSAAGGAGGGNSISGGGTFSRLVTFGGAPGGNSFGVAAAVTSGSAGGTAGHGADGPLGAGGAGGRTTANGGRVVGGAGTGNGSGGGGGATQGQIGAADGGAGAGGIIIVEEFPY